MTRRNSTVVWTVLLIGLFVVLPAAILLVHLQHSRTPLVLRGAIIKQDSDPRNESPIANVQVSAQGNFSATTATSDFLGSFVLRLRPEVKRGQRMILSFRSVDFRPLNMSIVADDQLYVARMVPLQNEVEAEISKPGVLVSNVLIRYTTVMTSTENIGSAAKTFQIVNKGNLPCGRNQLCSPDGEWKAQQATASLDAGEGNLFRDARVTCIAGPCPFTRVDKDGFSQGGRLIAVTMRDWSDTATFLLQGEVYRQQIGDIVRQSYAVIFGRTLNFTLPPEAGGPSIIAELDRSTQVFALGPSALLSWATCNIRVERNGAKEYRCELKPGYRFQ